MKKIISIFALVKPSLAFKLRFHEFITQRALSEDGFEVYTYMSWCSDIVSGCQYLLKTDAIEFMRDHL